MQPEEIQSEIGRISKLIGSFAPAVKEGEVRKRIEEIDNRSVSDPAFWSKRESKALLKEQSKYKKFIEDWNRLKTAGEDAEVLWGLYKEGETSVISELEESIPVLNKLADDFELKLILNGDNDLNNAILTIHPGAGGTESSDWASMLMRMYTRWAEQEGFKLEILDYLDGEEAGIKSVTMNIVGDYAYGYLKGETGVHRLVRISPFDSQSRRHTSFASVFVLPEIDDDVEVDINEGDLRIDTFRAGGAGGQHVNTTDSAVRITHLPTNIVVSSQSERSQHKNKAHAMKILRARLYEHEMSIRNSEKDKIEASKSDIGWGNQIRSYVMHPYKMVKDLRTRHETGNVDYVMDGGLDPFIRAYLLFSAGILEVTGDDKDLD